LLCFGSASSSSDEELPLGLDPLEVGLESLRVVPYATLRALVVRELLEREVDLREADCVEEVPREL
jgi:hypothetical protein